MFNIQLPQIERAQSTTNYALYRIEPLEPGWGHTLGSALRRILLSSLRGAAVTAIRFDPLTADMSGVEGVQEDLLDIILNVKQVRLRAESEALREARVVGLREQSARNGGAVLTAADLALPDGVQVLNPDQVIATLERPDAPIELALLVEEGRGYVAADERDDAPLDMIPIDAIYTPIPRVNYIIEHTRVGMMTNYDRLLLEIWTDGTITPDEAISQASRILTRYATSIASFGQETEEVPEASATPGAAAASASTANMTLEDLKLSVRTLNALKRANINSVAQVLATSDNDLLALRNFGQKSLDELKAALEAHDIIRGAG
ncbi:MAG TPA: DNA-directed RNA polymerase subunit alpha [Chloroflexia bacterium]|nr:DNA-directed RNA polymerase subunit alpha [Chloroflexia bacterium]